MLDKYLIYRSRINFSGSLNQNSLLNLFNFIGNKLPCILHFNHKKNNRLIYMNNGNIKHGIEVTFEGFMLRTGKDNGVGRFISIPDKNNLNYFRGLKFHVDINDSGLESYLIEKIKLWDDTRELITQYFNHLYHPKRLLE